MHTINILTIMVLVTMLLVAILTQTFFHFGLTQTNMNARFSTPDAAFHDALGSQGWLDRAAQITFLTQHTTTEGVIVVYAGAPTPSAPPGTTRWISWADAKPSWRGWYTHGRFHLPQPPALQESDKLTCAITKVPSSGERFLVVSGFASAAITQVAVTFDTQQVQVIVYDGAFAALGTDAVAVRDIVASDARGHSMPVDYAACVTP